MLLSEILEPDMALARLRARSRKQVLGDIASRINRARPEYSTLEIVDGLIARERLGSTAICGSALPHCRIPERAEDGTVRAPGALAAVASLDAPIDFDANDGMEVDLLFVLLVVGEANGQHLQLLAQVARIIRSSGVCDKLRGARSGADMLQMIKGAEALSADA